MIKEYIVTKDILNIRNKPSDENDDTYRGQLLKGSRVWVHENDVIGTIPKGGVSNIWKLRTDDSNLVSADGLKPITYQDKKNEFINDDFGKQFIDTTDPANEKKWKVSWGHVEMEIWKIWRDYETMGEDVKVAIIDSGIGNKILDLDNVINEIYAPTDSGNINDELGHGSLTAGIVGAEGKSLVYGIAPKCELIIIKREGVDGTLTEEFDYKSLKAVDNNIDILNISLEFVENTQRIYDELIRIANQGTLIIVAAGDGLSKLNNNIFPANHPNVISIAALDKNQGLYFQSLFNKNTKWIIPGEQLLSCNQFGQRGYHDATSAAAPFMSGVLCLLASLKKKNIIKLDYDGIFKQLSIDSTNILFQNNDSTFTFCLPNLIKTFTRLSITKI